MPKAKNEIKEDKDLHVKPTKEELEANAQKALAELEDMKDKKQDQEEEDQDEEERDEENDESDSSEGEESGDEEESAEEDGEDEDSGDEEDKSDEKGKSNEDDGEVEEKEKLKKELEEKNKKFISSTREAQILYARNKKVTEAIESASKIEPPTDEELKKEFSEWEYMSDFEKKMARDTMTLNKRLNAVTAVSQEFKDLELQEKKLDDYLADPKTLVDNPKLDGREEEFRTFASKPTRRGVDLEDITKAFLYEIDQTSPKKKGSTLDTKSEGTRKKSPEDDKLSVEEGRRLRVSNYTEYVKALRSGKIKSGI